MAARARTPVALSALLAAVYLVWDPASADLFAQRYRSWLFEQEGLALWNGRWYGGHHLPGYSLLLPPLGALLGPQLVGALSAVGATAAFSALARDRLGAGAAAASWWFALASVTSLLAGRLTFALGLAIALAAALAASRGRRVLAPVVAAVACAASPVAGAFLALAAAAWWLARPAWRPAVLAVAAVTPALLLAVAFPTGGTFPFVASSFLPVLAASALVVAVLPREARVLRIGAALYVVLVLLSGLVPSPMGGNAVRLGATFAGPLVAGALWPHRRRLLAVVAPALLYWQWAAPVDDVVRAAGDPSTKAAFHAPLLDRLARERGPVRLEVPFTDDHAEAHFLAQEVPLARGWERQLDRQVNGLLYEDGLTPERYARWLRETGVTHVALAAAPIDYSAAEEAALVRDGEVPALAEVWRSEDWRLFRVRGATPLATGAARAVREDPDEVVLRFARAGTARVKVRWTPYWLARDACVAPDGDWTRVTARRPGEVRLVTRFAPGRVRARSARCA